MKKIILAVAVAAVATMALVGSASAGPPEGITATPAASKTWTGHYWRRSSVRRAGSSTRRTGSTLAGVSEPLDGRTCSFSSVRQLVPADRHPTANPAATRTGSSSCSSPTSTTCRPSDRRHTDFGLLHQREPVQRVCLSGHPQVASGTIESSRADGTTADLPTASREATGSTYPARTPTATSTSPMPSTRASASTVLGVASAGLRRWPVPPR